jgi:hypothetical protein
LTDRETFEAIRSGVGGSFNSFFSKLFGDPGDEFGLSLETGEQDQEANPFAKARESLAESTPPAQPDSQAEAAPPAPQPQVGETDTGGADQPESATGNAAAVGATVLRPHLLLQLDEAGQLKVSPASQPLEGTFESADFGARDMNVRTFSDSANFPASIAVGDFNGDQYPDVAYFMSFQGTIRFFYGSADGFTEGLQVQVGIGHRSLAAGDFDGDGKTDLAISNVGTGLLTVLFANSRYKSLWLDSYRDFIAAGGTGGSTSLDLLGMNFGNTGTVLANFSDPEGRVPPGNFDYAPSFTSTMATSRGTAPRMNVVASGSNLSLNIENYMNQLINVLNVAAGCKVYVLVGDLDSQGYISISIGVPK